MITANSEPHGLPNGVLPVSENATRGTGLLEGMLARKRTTIADSLIPDSLRTGRILDIGCGTSPYFLNSINFREKYGVDQSYGTIAGLSINKDIHVSGFDIELGHQLPFESGFFDTVTMLAVLEHLERDAISHIISEIYRVLGKKGIFVGTTPVWWSDCILKSAAKLGIVSNEEIDEHKTFFTRTMLCSVIENGGFSKENIRTGYFEFGMNFWFTAQKN